jgi:hypothetical protein
LGNTRGWLEDLGSDLEKTGEMLFNTLAGVILQRAQEARVAGRREKSFQWSRYNHDGFVEFVVWLGNDGPKPKIKALAQGYAQDGSIMWRSSPNCEILLRPDSIIILAKAMNTYLSRCTEEEYAIFMGCVPCCRIFYDDIECKCGYDLFFQSLDPVPGYERIFTQCPANSVVCMVWRQGFAPSFFYAPFKNMKRGGNISRMDIQDPLTE